MNPSPPYPKGHAGRIFLVLAAIDRLSYPTSTSIAQLTGLSKGNVDAYVGKLIMEYQVDIKKQGVVYLIEDWGLLLNRDGIKVFLDDFLKINL